MNLVKYYYGLFPNKKQWIKIEQLESSGEIIKREKFHDNFIQVFEKMIN